MAHDVFISYSSHDKAAADAVCQYLEARDIRCWYAPRDVLPGSEWGASLVEAIESSRIMVLLFSTAANDSPQVRREIERAVGNSVTIIPMRIEDVMPGKSLDYFLSSQHWLDALSWPLADEHLAQLADSVSRISGRRPRPVARPPASPRPAWRPRPSRRPPARRGGWAPHCSASS